MPGPLDGLKVLDFTTLLPGPFATLILADMGADVLRAGSGSRPDLVELLPPFIGSSGVSSKLAYLGRGKRAITLDLKKPRSKEIVHRLIQTYDVLIEQFRPGVMAKLELDYDRLKHVNPELVYCSLTGYGQNGPMEQRAGHDINYLSQAGVMSYSGRKETGPVLSAFQAADLAGGSQSAVIAILAGVFCRNATGKGQHLDVAMTDCMAPFNALAGTDFLVDGLGPKREEHLLNGGSLYDFYETSDGEYMSFGGLEPKFSAAFLEAIGRPDLVSGGVVPGNLSEVKKEVRAIIRSKTRDEWVRIFRDVDACFEPVLSLEEALTSPHSEARGLVVSVPAGGGTTVRQLAHPIKFSETAPHYRHIGCKPGTHNREVMTELGYPEEEIELMRQEGIFN
ncbi:MAG: CoA transferase [Deltaproteobacteria bacterium]|nr:CoA transferase [Deltaproteobacteria bacterium]